MYLKNKVKIPADTTGISRKTIRGITYVYYTYKRTYDATKKYTKPICTSIGKCPDDDGMMYPNSNYLRFFPDAELPEDDEDCTRSSLSLIHI